VDENGRGLKGFDWVSITGDGIELPVAWEKRIGPVANKPVCIEFELQDAMLFGFNLDK
jgi:hypothetical protein